VNWRASAASCAANCSIRQDEVEAQRNDLISQLEVQLQQQVDEQTLFTIEWELT
jgi:hypothetical protein